MAEKARHKKESKRERIIRTKQTRLFVEADFSSNLWREKACLMK